MKLPIGVRQALIMTGCGINLQIKGGLNRDFIQANLQSEEPT
jgi:hypothetical protein